MSRANHTLLKSCCSSCTKTQSFYTTPYCDNNFREIIQNGNFETGNLAPWRINGPLDMGTCPNAIRNWHVSDADSTGCLSVGNPIYGKYAMYNMLDGVANTIYDLDQDITIPRRNSAVLSWDDRYVISMVAAQQRTISINFYNGSTLVGNAYFFTFPLSGEQPWTHHSVDVTSIISGYSRLTIRFTIFIPDTWTGPGGYVLDNVSLTIN